VRRVDNVLASLETVTCCGFLLRDGSCHTP
jgi:hypothetical protein